MSEPKVETLAVRIRMQAVENVDRLHGYTMEFAPSPEQHRIEYDVEEERLRAELANDPGVLICQHPHRVHSLGGGQYICFKCWTALVAGVGVKGDGP